MKTHAAIGAEALERAMREVGREVGRERSEAECARANTGTDPLAFLHVAREIAGCHHEKWDGSGYPAGLRCDAIPVSARLMALADVFDALISRRVYKAAMPLEQVRQILLEGRARHFDPDIVDAYLQCEAEFMAIAQQYADEPETPP
jgi:putative two-component system response regulator